VSFYAAGPAASHLLPAITAADPIDQNIRLNRRETPPILSCSAAMPAVPDWRWLTMDRKTLTLALQGGGSHGAFTWGVLDRLLEDARVQVEGISGASAGAVNAVVLAYGYTVGGRDGARAALDRFWTALAHRATYGLPPGHPLGASANAVLGDVPLMLNAYLGLTRYFSPQQLNPLDLNPLREVLAAQVDFERLRAQCPVKLFVAATRVRTGTLKLFEAQELSLEATLASACLPFFHRAVEIDGVAYWDGGLTANPPLFPLIHGCEARDLVAVLLQPQERPQAPVHADEIRERFTEIGLGATFYTEMQRIDLAKQESSRNLLSLGRLDRRFRQLNVHVIDPPASISRLPARSRLSAHPSFVGHLHDAGREAAELWLHHNFQAIGKRSSWKLPPEFGAH
jgi:NTE family protein